MKRWIKVGIIFSIVLIFFGFLLVIFQPKIVLKNNKVINLLVNSDYKEPGYSAKYLWFNIDDKVKIKGYVNNNKIGKYYLNYELDFLFYKKVLKRVVKVVDNDAPIINLVGETDYFVCPGVEYKEPGYSAIDPTEGDITGKVMVNSTPKLITYSISDESGNIFKIERNIVYQDKKGPTLTLEGSADEYILVNSIYEEKGYKAIDNCNGDLTSLVTISGTIDTTKLGEQDLIYSVKDTYGNKTTTTRKVIVHESDEGIIKPTIPNETGVIYLTFDDGPSSETTPAILDILNKYNIKATFFVTAKNADLISREYNEGHQIALHTATHNYSYIYSSPESYFEDLQTVSDYVFNATGYRSMMIRFPGGSSNTVSRHYYKGIMSVLATETLNRGFTYYDWTLDSGDTHKGNTTDYIYKTVVNNLKPNKENIILCHDIKINTKNTLEQIINYGLNNKYTFKKIDENTGIIHQNIRN